MYNFSLIKIKIYEARNSFVAQSQCMHYADLDFNNINRLKIQICANEGSL